MDDAGFDLRAFLGVVRRQFTLIAIAFIGIMMIAITYLFMITPMFSATALVLYDTNSRTLLDPQAQIVSAGDSAKVESEVELLKSDSILLKVVQSQDLVNDAEFAPSLGLRARLMALLRLGDAALPTGEQALNQTVGKLRAAYSVQRRGLTYLIGVTVRSEDPLKAADLANAIAEAYIENQVLAKEDRQSAVSTILAARAEQARNDMLSSESALDSFITENLQQIAQDAGRPDLLQMRSEIAALQQSRETTSATLAAARAGLGQNDLQMVAAQLQDEALARLQQERQALIDRGDINIAPPDLKAELARIESSMRDQASAKIQSLQQQLTDGQSSEAGLRETLRREVIASNIPSTLLADMYELRQRATIAQGQYQALLLRAQDVSVQAGNQIADSRIVSPALPPSDPSFPNTLSTLFVAGLIAIASSVALAMASEGLVGGFMSEEQVEAVLRTPVTGSIPREKLRPEDDSLSDLVVSNPLSVFAESVRRMRAMIQQLLRQRHQFVDTPVIMMTSTAPGEGKTTLALALARCYALAGQKTLLIDCDLRKPSLHRQLDLKPSHGLVEYLNNQLSIDNLRSIMASSSLENLTTIIGTKRSDLPTDQLLTGERFAGLMRAARASFDVVILDTPPLASVVDGLYIAPHADIIVFAAKWASTSQRDVRKSLTNLINAAQSATSILTVLNQQTDTNMAYRRPYGEYHDEFE